MGMRGNAVPTPFLYKLFLLVYFIRIPFLEKVTLALVSLDQSKAFDSVKHDTLARKLASISNSLCQIKFTTGFVGFVRGRSHVTRNRGLLSKERTKSASEVRESGIEPSTFIVCASDLHPVPVVNKMAKYAYDTTSW